MNHRIPTHAPVLAGIAAILLATGLWAITPEDVYQNARRSYLLGHWAEAADGFSRFLDRWPGHELCSEAVLHRLISESRAGFDRVRREYETARLASLTAGLAYVRQKLPDSDLVELEVELDCLRRRIATAPSDLASSVSNLSPEQLAHVMKRDVLPAPADDPRGTLRWIAAWKAKHGGAASGPVRATIELRKAKALLQIVLSPLPAAEMETELKGRDEFPPALALVRSIRAAFEAGEPDVKREAALLGVCCSSLAPVSRHAASDLGTWKTFLGDRGTHRGEAWCPR